MNRLRAPSIFALLLGVSLLAWWHPLAETIGLSLNNEEYTHILLILPLAVMLIVLDRHMFAHQPAPAQRFGSALLVLAAMLAGLAVWKPGLTQDVRLALSMLALVTWWIGTFVFCFGNRAFNTFRFPLLFLFWMVPFPSFLVQWIVGLLQNGSAFCTRILFEAAGIPISQDGLFLSIPGITLEVARECSSIRSSLILIVTSLVIAQLFLRSSWRKTLVLAVAVPLSVAKNGLRIFTIAMLGIRVDRGYLTGSFHHRGGVVFLVIALAVVFLLIWFLRRGENRRLLGGYDSAMPLRSTHD